MGVCNNYSRRWASNNKHLAFNEVMEKTSPLVVDGVGMEADPQTTNGEIWSSIIIVLSPKALRDLIGF